MAVPIAPLMLAGERYEAGSGSALVVLDVARTTGGGYSLRLRYEVRLTGPCMRCLEDAGRPMLVDAREVDQPRGGDDLSSPYVDGDELRLGAWAHDALALALPTTVVCRDECMGLCAVCGENLNDAAPDHRHEAAPDPRWAKLGELRLE